MLVIIANNHKIAAAGRGTVKLDAFMANQWHERVIQDVFRIPGAANLFSEGIFARKGYKIIRTANVTTFKPGKGDLGPIAEYYNGVYVMKFRPCQGQVIRAMLVKPSNAELWHRRLNHINMGYIRDTVRQEAVKGIDLNYCSSKVVCEDCE